MFKQILMLSLIGAGLQAGDLTKFQSFDHQTSRAAQVRADLATFFYANPAYLDNLVFIENALSQLLGQQYAELLQRDLDFKQFNLRSFLSLDESLVFAPALAPVPIVPAMVAVASGETKSFVATGDFLTVQREASTKSAFIATPGILHPKQNWSYNNLLRVNSGTDLVVLENNYANFQGALPKEVEILIAGIPAAEVKFFIDLNSVAFDKWYRHYQADATKSQGIEIGLPYLIGGCGDRKAQIIVANGVQGEVKALSVDRKIYVKPAPNRRIISYWVVDYCPGVSARVTFQILIDRMQLTSEWMFSNSSTVDTYNNGLYLVNLISNYLKGFARGGIVRVETLAELLKALKTVFAGEHSDTSYEFASLDPADQVSWNGVVAELEKLYGKVS